MRKIPLTNHMKEETNTRNEIRVFVVNDFQRAFQILAGVPYQYNTQTSAVIRGRVELTKNQSLLGKCSKEMANKFVKLLRELSCQ